MEKEIIVLKTEKLEGNTKEEALNKSSFKNKIDVTKNYLEWKEESQAFNIEVFVRQFCLVNDIKEGNGFYIEVKKAVPNKNKRTYNIINKSREGAKKYETVYQLIDKETNTILASVNGSKTEAKEAARKLYGEGFNGNLKCIYTKQVKEGEPLAFETSYKCSKGSGKGIYFVFGII